MITVNQILAYVQPGDWFISVDLRDAYFHIQITPDHRHFLRFVFEGMAYQFIVLPFGLSLAPCMITKCMDVALPGSDDGASCQEKSCHYRCTTEARAGVPYAMADRLLASGQMHRKCGT